MKILVIGGSGTIGRAIVAELGTRHEVICAGRSSKTVSVDITSTDSIHAMYQKIANIDAVIAATGSVHFAKFSEMQAESYQLGLQNKLMGQVKLVLIGRDYLNEGGSFTLTSGILNHDPIVSSTSAAMVNGALDGFVRAAAIEMPRQLRINIVSPTVISEAMDAYADFFRGFPPVPAKLAALAYSKSVEGQQTGQVYRVGY